MVDSGIITTNGDLFPCWRLEQEPPESHRVYRSPARKHRFEWATWYAIAKREALSGENSIVSEIGQNDSQILRPHTSKVTQFLSAHGSQLAKGLNIIATKYVGS